MPEETEYRPPVVLPGQLALFPSVEDVAAQLPTVEDVAACLPSVEDVLPRPPYQGVEVPCHD